MNGYSNSPYLNAGDDDDDGDIEIFPTVYYNYYCTRNKKIDHRYVTRNRGGKKVI